MKNKNKKGHQHTESSDIFILGAFSRRSLSKVTYSNSYSHTVMAVAAMQGADQHIRSSFEVQYLAQGHFNLQTREMEPVTFRKQTAGSTPES